MKYKYNLNTTRKDIEDMGPPREPIKDTIDEQIKFLEERRRKADKLIPRKRVMNVSEELWIHVTKNRIEWETPDAVLRRLLGLPAKQRKDKDEETNS